MEKLQSKCVRACVRACVCDWTQREMCVVNDDAGWDTEGLTGVGFLLGMAEDVTLHMSAWPSLIPRQATSRCSMRPKKSLLQWEAACPLFLKRCPVLFYSILRQFYFRSRNVCRFSTKVAVAFVLLKSIFLIYRMCLLFRWTEKFTTMRFSRLKCSNTTITQRVTVKLLLIWCVPPPVLSLPLSLLYFWHRV
jgi:hypothetical protein